MSNELTTPEAVVIPKPEGPAKYEAQLDDVQNIRFQMINALMEEGVPRTYKEQDILLRALQDADKSAMDRMKAMGIDGNTDIARSVDGLLNAIAKSMNPQPFRASTPAPRVIDMDIPEILDDSEINEHMVSTEHNSGKTNYDEFTTGFLEAHPEFAVQERS